VACRAHPVSPPPLPLVFLSSPRLLAFDASSASSQPVLPTRCLVLPLPSCSLVSHSTHNQFQPTSTDTSEERSTIPPPTLASSPQTAHYPSMMMMAYSGQAHSSHPEARHPHQFATSLSSGSSPQWIPTARDRLLHSRGSSSFYAAAHSQPFVSSSVPNHSSGGFFSDTMSSAELTGSVPPARSTVPPMNRTLSLDTTTWPVSAPANDWSLRAAGP
jgi:hypothetical protein